MRDTYSEWTRVAVYRIVERGASKVREGEIEFHHHYAGQLLARVYPDLAPITLPGPPRIRDKDDPALREKPQRRVNSC